MNKEQILQAAQQRLAMLPPEEKEKLREVQMRGFTIGVVAVRELLSALVREADAKNGDERTPVASALLKEISEIESKYKDKCKMELGTSGGGSDRLLVAISLELCDQAHDMTAQMQKLFQAIPRAQYTQAQREISRLVGFAMTTYGQIVRGLPEFVARLTAHVVKFDPAIKLDRLAVDSNNTTLYLNPKGKRLGVVVEPASSVGPAPP